MRRSTVTEILLRLNDPEKARRDHGEHYLSRMTNDNAAIYEQSDYLANWYKRNLRMFANLNRITEFPGDRVLLIVGSGHLGILRDFALDAPQYKLIEPTDYLK